MGIKKLNFSILSKIKAKKKDGKNYKSINI